MNKRLSIHLPSLVVALQMTFGFTASKAASQDDVADVTSTRRTVGEDKNKAFFEIPAAADSVSRSGYGLLVILPGGNGSADFHTFIKRIHKNAVPAEFIVVQPIAVRWTAEQKIVWPTDKLKVQGQQFSTEAFVRDVINDVGKRTKIDRERVICMGWSSSGTAVYSLALQQNPIVSSSYVSMSVYKPNLLPALKNAKGRRIYIEHSPQDRVCPFWMAKKAFQDLSMNGSQVKLTEYAGGHGWRGNVYGRIRAAIKWASHPRR